METAFPDETVVVVASDKVSSPLGSEVVILDLEAGLYFSLDEVGAQVWQLMQEPRSVGELRQAILRTYEVTPDICRRDLVSLLQDLATRGLIQVEVAPRA